MTKDTSGPAFPVPAELCQDLTIEEQRGLTVRDYFAAKAMQAIVDSSQYQCGGDLNELENLQGLAKDSYAVADAMLAARKQ